MRRGQARLTGFEILCEKNAYSFDPRFGYVVASRAPAPCPPSRPHVAAWNSVTAERATPNPRALYPLARKQGRLTRVSWEEALDTAVKRFREVQRQAGFSALAVLVAGPLGNENSYTLGKLAQLGFGTGHFNAVGFPAAPGPTGPDIAQAVLARRVRALWIIVTSPIAPFPPQGLLQRALANLDFLVAQGPFHPTPVTTDLADLVLPTTLTEETAPAGPACEARPDFDIFLDIAGRLGIRDELFPGWTTPADAFEEWQRLSSALLVLR